MRLESYSRTETHSHGNTAGTVTVLSSYPINQMKLIAGTIVTQYQLTLDSGAAGALSAVNSPSIKGDNYWYDAGTQVTYSGNGVFGRSSGTGSRVTTWWWDSAAATPVTTTGTFPASITMNAPHELHTTTVTQFQLTLDPKAAGALATVTSPTITSDKYWYDTGTVVTYKGYGVFDRASGVGNRSTSWTLDSGAPTDLTTTGNFTIMGR